MKGDLGLFQGHVRVRNGTQERVRTEQLELPGACLCGLLCLFPEQVWSKLVLDLYAVTEELATAYLEPVVMDGPKSAARFITVSFFYETTTLLETQISFRLVMVRRQLGATVSLSGICRGVQNLL